MVKPTVSEFKTALSAADAFERISQRDHAFFLDSGDYFNGLGRFSFIGCEPFLIFQSRGRTVRLHRAGSPLQVIEADPFDVLRELLNQYRQEALDLDIPFTGGAVGYFSYDMGRLIEKLPSKTVDDLNLPECYLAFYDSLIAFDHLKGKQYIVSADDAGAERLMRVLSQPPPSPTPLPTRHVKGSLKSNFTREEYLRTVEKTREYILNGDIFQANLSQRFEAPLPTLPYDLYRRLRSINPAPFATYLNFDGVKIISASPERFLKLEGDRIQTRPIKGTRPRGKNPAEDARLAAELLASPKDHAENAMIVDLERNDLGRVSIYGSVRMTELAALETCPTVFHLTSMVEGRLRQGLDRIDLLRAAFPGGSISGAPKVRAMQIIEELEPTRRSVYTGAIGYLGFNGGLDLNIAIRTILAVGERAYFQVGGGIVYDSDPEAEYQETFDKARALIAALGLESPGEYHDSGNR